MMKTIEMMVGFASLAAAIPLTTRADPTCLEFLPEWECNVCDGYNPSAPVVCSPFNATFDDLPADQPVGTYKSTKWTNFNVVDSTTTATRFGIHVNATSPPNYARLPANQLGNLTFGFEDGVAPGVNQIPVAQIYSFNFACADSVPDLGGAIPDPCKVTIAAECLPIENLDNLGNTTRYAWSLDFTPPSTGSAAMQYFQGPLVPDRSHYCTSYQFVVEGADRPEPQLLLDEVLFTTLQQGH